MRKVQNLDATTRQCVENCSPLNFYAFDGAPPGRSKYHHMGECSITLHVPNETLCHTASCHLEILNVGSIELVASVIDHAALNERCRENSGAIVDATLVCKAQSSQEAMRFKQLLYDCFSSTECSHSCGIDNAMPLKVAFELFNLTTRCNSHHGQPGRLRSIAQRSKKHPPCAFSCKFELINRAWIAGHFFVAISAAEIFNSYPFCLDAQRFTSVCGNVPA